MRPVIALAATFLSLTAPGGCALSQTMRLRVDATDLPRHVVRAEAVIPVELLTRDASGDADVWYVEWVPGNHNPSNPIQNLVEFRATDDRGRAIEWRRDPARTVRKTLRVPPDAREVRLSYVYIASQPWVNSRSSDTYGLPAMGGLNFNNVLFYPAGADKNTLMVDAELLLPDGWSASTSLMAPGEQYVATADGRPELVDLSPASLARHVDSPVIMGEHLRVWELDSQTPGAPHTFEGVAPDPKFLEMPPARLAKFNRMLAEAQAVFGPFPWAQFRFLILFSDDLPGFGLEHRESTYIRYGANTLVNSEKPGGSPMTTVPHEYIHAWVGKLVAQRGLLHADYHTPADTRLMWVYEGLTSYYDEVLAARSRLYTLEEFRDSTLDTIRRYLIQPGRLWKSVEDTGAGLRHLREPSARFEEHRRRQDYYAEGGLFWMEADAIIRGGTGNARSLDDFCRAFYGVSAPEGDGSVVEHTRDDVVRALRAVYSGVDWDALIRERIESPRTTLGFESLAERLGYRLEFRDEPFTKADAGASTAKSADLRTSLGVSVDENGRITSILMDSPAWRAGLGHDMTIVGVRDAEGEERAYSADALRAAVRDSRAAGCVGLLVNRAGSIDEVSIAYDGGLRYPALTPIKGAPDLLRAIAAPRTGAAD